MTPRKSNGFASPAEPTPARSTYDWFAALLERRRLTRALPVLQVPRRKELRTPRSGWLATYWAARRAVRSGVPIQIFLQHRVWRRLARLPLSPSRLPVVFDVDECGSIVTAPSGATARRAPWLESFLRAAGPAALNPQIQLAQADAARLAARIDGQRQRVDELTRDLEQATRGVAVADPRDEAQARQMGRPIVPPAVGLALQVLATVLLLAAAWPIALPCFQALGVEPTQLHAELQRDPVGLVIGALFALGATTALLLLAQLGLRGVLASAIQAESPRRSRWSVLTSGVAVVLAIAAAWCITAVQPVPELSVRPGQAHATIFLALLSIPFAAAWLLAVSQRMEATRGAARSLASAWDQEHYRTLADLSRRAGVVAEEERRLASLEAERTATVRRLRALQERCATAERIAADAAAQEDAELSRMAQAITASLELDRYEYLRQSCAREIPVPKADDPVLAPVATTKRGTREVPEPTASYSGGERTISKHLAG